MRNLFRLQKTKAAPVFPMYAELEQLKGNLGEEIGLESGYNGFPREKAEAMAAAEVQQLAVKQFGPLVPQSAQSPEQEAELQKELKSVEEKQFAYRERYGVKPARRDVAITSAGAPAGIRWLAALVSIASPFALAGLAIEAFGMRLGWRGWLALALLAAPLAVHLPALAAAVRRLVNLPAWLGYGWARYLEYRDYRRLVARAGQLAAQIQQIRQERETEALRLRQAEEWIARNCELIMSHFGYHQTRGATAAQLAR